MYARNEIPAGFQYIIKNATDYCFPTPKDNHIYLFVMSDSFFFSYGTLHSQLP